MRERLKRLKKGLARNNQKGFTLIELLVVVSILGILAAVVTISVAGINANATNQAKATELHTLQAAFDADVATNNLDYATACGSGPPSGTDIANWPSGHSLYPTYVHERNSKWAFTCNASDGTLSN